MNCMSCSLYPELKDKWGCIKPIAKVGPEQKIPDEKGNIYEYYSCPTLFNMPIIDAFISEYRSTKDGISVAKHYEDQDSWYIEASEYYQYWIYFCLIKKDLNV